MADDVNKRDLQDYDGNHYVDPNLGANTDSDYKEETAAEVAAPINYGSTRNFERADIDTESRATGGTGMGWLALALSIISLFVMPVIMGAAGIIIGFIARRRGATGLGAWAIGIGAISIIVGIFILPFF
ncbi:DUF4190 domain-containing protein [Fredinandcohnia quinoae]|uniref:DUF4190 domain-containing protein n=1 Tax=Fredinandcohnia quinoae TaxID=2918902 RepID=A0AAW5E2E8_9BACI|nr:DUF4190 domain-containing protein [Fredinandcohnia sp. SECRCQ15]MCH1624949.1 DUF4190 domain-containing protein [Fredinandcohnia sp. SECRCQ15]